MKYIYSKNQDTPTIMIIYGPKKNSIDFNETAGSLALSEYFKTYGFFLNYTTPEYTKKNITRSEIMKYVRHRNKSK